MADQIIASGDATSTTIPHEPLVERELSIDVDAEFGWVRYEGTRAQLVDEGLIHEGLDWPTANANRRWSANGFDYWLRRTRPDGHKGPMRSWLEMDNWFICVEVTGRDHSWRERRYLERKAAELSADYHRITVAGQREWQANFDRYWAARNDKGFQSFKAIIIPERKKSGRKPKARGAEAAR